MATKRKHSAIVPEEESVDPSDQLMFLGLGGCNEVGRSCHILQYKGKTVMLDAGMHPAYDGHAALPYFDEFDLSTIDVLLISHFHIDHAAALPYVLSKTSFKGRVFMTHSTKAIYKWLIQDSVRVGTTATSSEQRTQLYTEHDHLSTFPQIEAIDYHTTHTVSGIRITPYPAGHVLGAAMFHLDIAGLSILFTGDYSREEDRHLIPATFPSNTKVDVLITESTYGVASHTPRKEREAHLLRTITGILDRGGRALLPVFALGRAQELLLILDEYWAAHPEYQRVPIYYASNLARKCMVVYQTYIGAMNDNIKRRFRERMAEASTGASAGGPWDFRFIRSLKSLDRFDDVGPSVMLASPGMMQNGVSRELLERWAPDARNGVVITGYSVEGTMAKQIMNEAESIPAVMTKSSASVNRRKDNETRNITRRCSVAEYSFAAHVDGTENRDFIEAIAAPNIVLVHGERHNMARLKSRLLSLNQGKAEKDKARIHNPHNCDTVHIPIRQDKIARVVGKLAERVRPNALQGEGTSEEEKQIIRNAVLVENDFKLSLMDPEDLREYAGLTTTTILCRQKLTLASASLSLIRWALEGAFGGVEELPSTFSHDTKMAESLANGEDGSTTPPDDPIEEIDRRETRLKVMDVITLIYRAQSELIVEWEGNVSNDSIADAVVAVLLGVESSPAAVKMSSKLNGHSHNHDDEQMGNSDQNGQHALHNPHAHVAASTQYSRLLLFLEAQFGSEGITPLSAADLPSTATDTTTKGEVAMTDAMNQSAQTDLPVGVPPALKIAIDANEALVWMATGNVECKHAVTKARVQAVLERAMETVAPVWRAGG
ncbi:MAG: hypothetical protein Q9159_004571 [Coniocarpon cinnabarinum]